MNHHPRLVPVLIACLIAAFLTACLGGSPEKTAEEFYRAIEAGEISDAMELLNEDTYDHVGRDKIRAALEMQTRRIADQGGIKKFEVVKSDVRGEIADLEVLITLGDGTTMNETVNLHKIDGEWKLESRK
jgi:hypothetical protein